MANTSWIAGGFLAVIQILYMLNFSSIIAISKEEKSAIISKYLPIKFSEQLKLKMITGKIINLITGIGMSALYYAFTNNIIYGIVVLIISIIKRIYNDETKYKCYVRIVLYNGIYIIVYCTWNYYTKYKIVLCNSMCNYFYCKY